MLSVVSSLMLPERRHPSAADAQISFVSETKVCPLKFGESMVANAGIELVLTLDASYSPFLSMPAETQQAIAELAQRFAQ